MEMESPHYAPTTTTDIDASRPSLGFPLGIALLLIIIFTLSGVFSCCYHWDKLRSLRRSSDNDRSSPSKPKPTDVSWKPNGSGSVSVLMPGDQIPKFIALPCPCEPPPPASFALEVDKQPPPPKPPQIAVPLYI
ncbi:uncharacterized protein At5g65660-like [Diospyros lotus]|uniref:uncharacterized protein At5g65660-like n=1 Tax=Diospyros lotus TaxID=55363 RepID=UPI0022567201|nr:uncharacterized protein At5g65660-like [Diospyros lotus]